MATHVVQVGDAVKLPCSACLRGMIYGAAFYHNVIVLTLKVQPFCLSTCDKSGVPAADK